MISPISLEDSGKPVHLHWNNKLSQEMLVGSHVFLPIEVEPVLTEDL